MSDAPSNSTSTLGAAAPGHSDRAHLVRRRLLHVAREHPLIETRPSLHALRRPWKSPPSAVFTGIGLASGRTVTRALPLDVLGLLLSAEHVRRASQAHELLVVVADAHALAHGAPPQAVLERARRTDELLQRIARACRMPTLRVIHGSELDADPDYRALLRLVSRKAPASTDPYVLREIADIGHLDAQHGGVLKVGWALQASPRGVQRDERMFDRRFQQWLQRDVGLIYAKAGRTLDDTHQRMPPYLEWDPARRICLSPGEDVRGKLAAARAHASASTIAGVRKHLRAIARSYGKLVRPLRGSLEQRVQAIVDDLCATSAGRFSLTPQAASDGG